MTLKNQTSYAIKYVTSGNDPVSGSISSGITAIIDLGSGTYTMRISHTDTTEGATTAHNVTDSSTVTVNSDSAGNLTAITT